MKTNENIRNDTSDDITVLGVASIETKGPLGNGEGGGNGNMVIPGISEE